MTVKTPGDLTTGSLASKTLGFGIPLALAMMGHGLFNLVDLIIVGRLPEGSITAVTVAGIILTVAMLLFDGVSNVTVALTAHAHGARLPRMVRDVAWESLFLALAGGLGGGLVFYLLSEPVVLFYKIESAETAAAGIEYLEVMSIGMVTMLLIMQTTAVLRGVGDARWPLWILVGSNVLNLVLDIVLVFGYLGFPKMGVAGAAWATNISRGAGAAVGFWLLWRRSGVLALSEHPPRRPLHYVRSLLFVGLPTSVQLAARVLSFFFLLKIASDAFAGAPDQLIDGVGICIRLEMVAVFLGLGWGAAATTVVGQNLGAGNPHRAARGTWILVAYAVATMLACGAFIWYFREPLIRLISPDIGAEARAAAETYLRVTVFYYPLLAVSFVLSRALNGATSTKTPMAIDLVAMTLLNVLAAWLSGAGIGGWFQGADESPAGAWWAAFLVHGLLAAVYVLAFCGGAWKRKDLTRHRRPHPLDYPG